MEFYGLCKEKWSTQERATLTNNETGETFEALLFPTPQGEKEFTIVAFNSDLGELSVSEIVKRKFELYVVKLESGNYYLCDSKSLQVENIVNGLTDNKDNNYSI